ncbi:MAG: class I SAM-dependent methyltransferase [Anaerovoracaceae bacterium]
MNLVKPAAADERIWSILANDKNSARYKILLSKPITDPVLEIGCHYGYLACLLAKSHYVDVIALDLDPEYLRIAAAVAEKNNVVVKLIKANAKQLPFGNNEIGTVFLCEMLEHLEDPLPVLNEAIRVTRDYLYITTPAKGVMPPAITRGHKQDFSLDELILLVEGAGVTVTGSFVDETFNYVFTRK